jgi:hypothetical protein
MATTIVISCPNCKKQIKAPAELEGKKIRCKNCGQIFAVQAAADKHKPDARPAKGPAAPAKKEEDESFTPYAIAETDEDAPLAPPPPSKSSPAKGTPPAGSRARQQGDDFNPYQVTDIDLAPRCPQCAAELESETSVICLNCGYNLQTREYRTTVRTIEHTTGERVRWLLPGIACVVAALAFGGLIAYLWLGLDPHNEKGEWYEHLATQIWGTVISSFIIFLCGRFAISRLIFHPIPPEKIAPFKVKE